MYIPFPHLSDIIDALICWTLEGLDFEKAIAQPENKYKLRHLKMGIKLVGCLSSCDANICWKIMVSLLLLKVSGQTKPCRYLVHGPSCRGNMAGVVN
jgi:hypothetical protein